MSARDVAIYDDDLRATEEDIANRLNKITSMSGDSRADALRRVGDLHKGAQKSFLHFRVEIRSLNEQTEQEAYEKKCDEHKRTLEGLKERLTQLKNEPMSGSPAEGAGGQTRVQWDPNDTTDRGDGKDQARSTARNVTKIQDSTLAALDRTEQTVGETQEIANEATDTLAKQGEQMQRVNERLDHLDSEVKRGKNELNAFIRRMMTDKILMCCVILVIIAIIVVIALKITHKGDDSTPEGAAAVTPAPVTPAPIAPSLAFP